MQLTYLLMPRLRRAPLIEHPEQFNVVEAGNPVTPPEPTGRVRRRPSRFADPDIQVPIEIQHILNKYAL